MSKMKLDEIDHQILDMLIENTRTPFTDIAKKLLISAGTVHVRVKKMEEYGLIKGSSLILDYDKLGYTFIAYIGIFLEKTHLTNYVLEKLESIPYAIMVNDNFKEEMDTIDDLNTNSIISSERIYLGHRIRDFLSLPNGKIIALTDDQRFLTLRRSSIPKYDEKATGKFILPIQLMR